jgi:hypothetical protein
MDTREAERIMSDCLEAIREEPYDVLSRRVGARSDSQEVRGAKGTAYQLVVEYFWDEKRGGPVRVVAAIDDGGLRAFRPLTMSFIKAVDGSFVGE